MNWLDDKRETIAYVNRRFNTTKMSTNFSSHQPDHKIPNRYWNYFLIVVFLLLSTIRTQVQEMGQGSFLSFWVNFIIL